jgi:hypothetical protein
MVGERTAEPIHGDASQYLNAFKKLVGNGHVPRSPSSQKTDSCFLWLGGGEQRRPVDVMVKSQTSRRCHSQALRLTFDVPKLRRWRLRNMICSSDTNIKLHALMDAERVFLLCIQSGREAWSPERLTSL